MDRDRTAYADGNALGILIFESKYLPKGAHIQPGLAGLLRVGGGVLEVLRLSQNGRGTFTETVVSIVAPVVGLDEDRLSQVLHPVAQLALDAHVAHFPQTGIVGAGAVAVEGVAIGICHGDGGKGHKVDFVL